MATTVLLAVASGAPRSSHSPKPGCVPYFLPEAIAAKTINTRGESVADKPSFCAAFRRRRCIVPINGFYEWQTVAGNKQPFYIHPVGEEFFGLAGLSKELVGLGIKEYRQTFFKPYRVI